MRVVRITKNAKLKRDGEGLFWLIIETEAGSAMFNLSSFETNSITGETKSLESDEVLEAFMEEQKMPVIESPN